VTYGEARLRLDVTAADLGQRTSSAPADGAGQLETHVPHGLQI
jgi:hypothetical protein